MGRKERLFFEGIALHIYLKGINEEDIFRDKEDSIFYKKALYELSKSMYIDIHSYSLTPTEIYLLCTFPDKDTLSRFMQSLGLKYVSYFNKKYDRKGTLWQGRYKSSPVEDKYILSVMSFIETMPKSLFNSFFKNAMNRDDKIITSHEMYKLLGKDDEDRASVYKNRYIEDTSNIDAFIQEKLYQQGVTGDLEFCKKLEKLSGEVLTSKKRGRPKKNIKEKKRMFKNFVVLDKKRHKDLKVSPLENLNFAKELSFVPVLANEVSMVGEVFPVVFTAEETPSLVALTSLGGKNLAINEEGKYITKYIPAFLRRYPFSLANTKEDPEKKVVVIDEDATNLSKTKGKQLFTKDGEESETLKNAVNFLTEYEKQHQSTLNLVKTIVDADILEDREISVGEGEDKKVLVKVFKVVSREKLNKLDDETLASWVRNGIISFIDLHIKSLSKIEVLFKIASQNQKQQG